MRFRWTALAPARCARSSIVKRIDTSGPQRRTEPGRASFRANGLWLALLFACSGVHVACSPRAAVSPGDASSTGGHVASVEQVDHTVVTAEEASDVVEVLRRAEAALSEEKFDDALVAYDRLLRVDAAAPDARTPEERSWRAQAWFGAGTVHDLRGAREAALRHYSRVAERFPEHQLAGHAEVRSVRLLVHLERLEEAAALARRALEGSGVSRDVAQPSERGPLAQVALLSAVALDLAARGDDVGAMRYVARGQQVIEGRDLDRADTLPRDLAQLYFALGEVRRLRAERLTFDPMPADFAARLEERCQLLLDAQSAYSDAMRAHDAHWSAMAGYRVGELYQRLHEDLMGVEPPSAADTQARRALFEGAMRLRYSILLRKSRTMLEHTLRMIERTAHETRWAEKARAAHEAILEAIEREEAALARLPYTRGELEAALEQLAGRGARPDRTPAPRDPAPRGPAPRNPAPQTP